MTKGAKVDMDDFGPTLFKINLKEAIEMGIVEDYCLVGSFYEEELAWEGVVDAVARVVAEKDCRKIIMYHKFF
jgi:predicted helicase